MIRDNRVAFFAVGVLCLFALAYVSSCGKKSRYDTNLLKNPSFEEYSGRIPEGWQLSSFRGLEGEQEVEYGIDSLVAFDGFASFYFKGDRQTGRWYTLFQEVPVKDVTRVRIRGAIRSQNVIRYVNNYAQCNFVLIFFDKDHNRFQDVRFYDKRTTMRLGTADWTVEERNFRVPANTAYITVACIFGMTGTVWFDGLSLEIPEPVPWRTRRTDNFDFCWLDERPFPLGAMENEQRLYDYYCQMLGVTSDERISYYLYPDSATIIKMLGLRKGVLYVSWEDREIHTIHPNENHEIIHMITDPYGVPPRAIVAGTVFALHGNFRGLQFHDVSRRLLLNNRLPGLGKLISYNDFVLLPMEISYSAASSFVDFIVRTWGPKRLIELYREANGVNDYAAFAKPFERVYGIPAPEAEIRWRQFLVRADYAKRDTTSVPPASGEGR